MMEIEFTVRVTVNDDVIHPRNLIGYVLNRDVTEGRLRLHAEAVGAVRATTPDGAWVTVPDQIGSVWPDDASPFTVTASDAVPPGEAWLVQDGAIVGKITGLERE